MDGAEAGERVFSVTHQGKTVLEAFDIAKAAGGPKRAVVREFKGVPVKSSFRLAFAPAKGGNVLGPVICGIEAAAEGQ